MGRRGVLALYVDDGSFKGHDVSAAVVETAQLRVTVYILSALAVKSMCV